MRVLIVENEARTALKVREGLIRAGHSAAIAMGKREIAFLASRNTFDLALVDLDVCSADEIAVASLLQSTHRVPSVFVCDRTARALAASQRALGIISKPFELADLIDALAFVECTLCKDSPSTQCPACLELFQSGEVAPRADNETAQRGSMRGDREQRTSQLLTGERLHDPRQ